jgi:hypothetical protein
VKKELLIHGTTLNENRKRQSRRAPLLVQCVGGAILRKRMSAAASATATQAHEHMRRKL